MTDHELIRELRSDSLLNRVRQLISQSAGRVDQHCRQRRPPSTIDIRRMQFEDAQKIIDLVRSHYADKVPTVEDIDYMHDSGNVGDLYIWCQHMRDLIVNGTSQHAEPQPEIVYACGFETSPNEFGMFAGPSPFLQKMTSINVDDYIRERTRDLGFVPTSACLRAYLLRFDGDQATKLAEWDHWNESWIPTKKSSTPAPEADIPVPAEEQIQAILFSGSLKKTEAQIVYNRDRRILKLEDGHYLIYIPLTDEERALLGIDLPPGTALRLRIENRSK